MTEVVYIEPKEKINGYYPTGKLKTKGRGWEASRKKTMDEGNATEISAVNLHIHIRINQGNLTRQMSWVCSFWVSPLYLRKWTHTIISFSKVMNPPNVYILWSLNTFWAGILTSLRRDQNYSGNTTIIHESIPGRLNTLNKLVWFCHVFWSNLKRGQCSPKLTMKLDPECS